MGSDDITVVSGPGRGVDSTCARCGRYDRVILRRPIGYQTALVVAAAFGRNGPRARCGSCGMSGLEWNPFGYQAKAN